MAFIRSGTRVVSFAEYDDCVAMDQRLFEENEGLTIDEVEDILIRSTERVLDILRNSTWYRSLALSQGASVLTIPTPSGSKIISRQNDFTDLCVYYAFFNYILPRVADFGSQDNAERTKIQFYEQKFSSLFNELIADGDWYDYGGNGTVDLTEKRPTVINYQRVR